MIEVILICIFGVIFGEIIYLFVIPKKDLEKDGYFISKLFALTMGVCIPTIGYIGFLMLSQIDEVIKLLMNTVMSPTVLGLLGAIGVLLIVFGYFKLNEMLRRYLDKRRENQ